MTPRNKVIRKLSQIASVADRAIADCLDKPDTVATARAERAAEELFALSSRLLDVVR